MVLKHYVLPEINSSVSGIDDVIDGIKSNNLKSEADIVSLNTRLTHKKLDSLIEIQTETNRLLKLILS